MQIHHKRPPTGGGGRPLREKPPKGPQVIPVVLRDPEVLTEKESRLSAEAVEVFSRCVGGRDALLDTLSVAHAAPEIEHIVNLMLDPRYERWTLRQLCETAGVTVADLFLAYRKAAIVKAHIEAAHLIARALPPVVEDVMRRATPQLVPCPECGGDPVRKVLCPACAASGQVRTEPELDRQKLALEIGGLLERKGGGIIVNNQTTVATGPTAVFGGGRGGTLVQLQQAIGELLYRPALRASPAVDVPVPHDDPPDEDEEEPTIPPDEDEDEAPPEGLPDQAARTDPPTTARPLRLADQVVGEVLPDIG